MVRLTPLLLAYAALALSYVSATDTHVHLRVHSPSHAATVHREPHALPVKPARKVFRVRGSKAAFDALLSPAVQAELQLDVWRIARDGRGDSDRLHANIAATDEAMAKLHRLMDSAASNSHTHVQSHGKGKGVQHHTTLHIKETDSLTDEERAAQDRKDVAACLRATKGYEKTLAEEASYADSAYFDCFRPYDQIWQFFDTLTAANPEFVTKIHNVSTTYEGRSVHAYKLSTSSVLPHHNTEHQPLKKAVYVQSLLHAREWQAGASTHFTFASLLDDLRTGDATTLKMFDTVDVYLVPLVNVDGYKYSWEVDRYWRVNRHAFNGYEGVDLNRNFPPDEFFNLDPTHESAETNPGEAPLSEPESRTIYDFILGLPELIGVVDIHAYAGMVLRPFSDIQGEPEEPYGSAMKRLGDAVRDAMSPDTDGFQYISQPSGALYPAYGCIDDAIYRETNYTVPALTIEVEGHDFIAPQDSIRDVGEDINNGVRRFVREALKYEALIQKVGSAN